MAQGRMVSKRWIIPAAALLLLSVYFLVNPENAAWMPKCIFKMTTGYNCPGCGSQRMAHALLHGNFAEAWRMNAFLLFLLPLLVFMIIADIWGQKWRVTRYIFSATACYTLLFLLIAWGVVRNIFGI